MFRASLGIKINCTIQWIEIKKCINNFHPLHNHVVNKFWINKASGETYDSTKIGTNEGHNIHPQHFDKWMYDGKVNSVAGGYI